MKIAAWIPSSTPAIKPDTCEVDEVLIIKRCAHVALLILASSLACAMYLIRVASFSYRSVVRITILDGMLSLYLLSLFWKVEQTRANVGADQTALSQYRDVNKVPTAGATNRIASNERLLCRLNTDELSKKNNAGQTVLDVFLTQSLKSKSKVFYYSLDPSPDLPKKFFLNLLSSCYESHIKCLLLEKKVTPADFTESEQSDIWMQVNPRYISLLHQYGFNLEAKGEDGRTALSKWAATPSHMIRRSTKVQEEFVEAMLECGAILTMEDIQTTEKELIVNPILNTSLELFQLKQSGV